MFKRVIIKISGEGLAGDNNEHFHEPTIDRITNEITSVLQSGVQVSLVVGGGNFWRGRDAKPEMDKVKAHQIGMVGTVMNGLYLSEAFRLNGLKAVVMTPFEFNGFTTRFTKESAIECMMRDEIVIFAGGTGHPFFSTDSIVALRACELNADAVLYAKNVDSVYSEDPRKNSNAKRYKTVSYDTIIGNNLDVADISALNLTSQQNIPSVVFSLAKHGSILTACKNNDKIFEIGATLVANQIKEEFYV